MRKLIMESVKTKEVLSSNKIAFYSSIGLYDGQDFQGNITRKVKYLKLNKYNQYK